ncbi:unnamed protein product [Rhizopus stolonifer]
MTIKNLSLFSVMNSLPPLLPAHFDSTDEEDFLDEHKFWQIPSSTLIISPTRHKVSLNLASQVKLILGSALEKADEEIEKEWSQR